MGTADHRKLILTLSSLLCIASLLLIIFLGHAYITNADQMLGHARDSAEAQAECATGVISGKLGELPAITESIADDLGTGKLKNNQVAGRLKDTLEAHPELFGVAAGYMPYEYDSKTRLYAPYCVWKRGEPELIQIEDSYDYTLPDVKDRIENRTVWYHRPLDEGAGWIDPYFGTASDTLLTVHAHPFYRANVSGGERNPAGVIVAVYSLDGVGRQVASLDLDSGGYGFILTEKGTVVAHPIREYLGRDIKELQETDETLRLISRNRNPGKHQQIFVNHTGRTSWVFYEQIPSSNWTLGVVFVEDNILESIKTSQRRLLIHIALAVMTFLFFLSILIFRVGKNSSSSLWAVAIVFSILCALGTGFIWHLALGDSSDGGSHGTDVFDKVGLEVAMHKLLQDHGVQQGTDQPIRIPTGIFLQSLRFSSANNVIVTGYVWQDYSDNRTANVSRGVIFPEAEEIKIEEAYDLDNGVTGWHFRAVLRQQFDYSKYPFDREDVWIRLWPGEFYRNVILTPDFGSYSKMHPDSKPGLEQDFVLEGWEIENSYFSYRKNSYTTTFGVDNPPGYTESPELYYSVGMRRNFMTLLVADLTPLVIVALLLFAVLMILTHNSAKISLYGFNASSVLAYCAALFFVLIVSHVSIRQKLAANGIIYLEYFYFVLYLAILTTSVNSILFASNTRSRFVHYRDNLIAKLLYWPIILGIIFGITLKVFY